MNAVSASSVAPSRSLDSRAWERAHVELVATLQDLIRIRSVNPPGDEILAARYLEAVLTDAGIRPEVVEPFPGRGSISCRLRGDGTGGEPLLLLSHLDVVPAPPELWSHDPFGGDIADGYIWGRGAVDMKGMVAMEVAIVRQLAAEARAAGRDPATDPIPGLTRDVLFTSTADEEAGGVLGAGWVVDHRPEWFRAAGALNEAGGVSVELAGRRFYPIQVAEKGLIRYRITVRGTWGHGSMPRDDNAAVRAAEVVHRLAPFEPPRLTPVMERLFEIAAAELPPEAARLVRAIASPDERVSDAALAQLCEPSFQRATRALLRDTMSPNMIHSGVKVNVIPGTGEVEIDVRNLPGTPEPEMQALIRRRLGEELWSVVTLEALHVGEPVEAPIDTELFELLVATLKEHDPEGIAAADHGAVRDRREAHAEAERPDLRLLAVAAAPRGPIPRAVPRRRRARQPRRPALRPAGAIRRGPNLRRRARLTKPGEIEPERIGGSTGRLDWTASRRGSAASRRGAGGRPHGPGAVDSAWRCLDQPAPTRDGSLGQGGHAHRDERALGRRQGPDDGQELVGPGSIDHREQRLPGRRQPEGALAAVFRFGASLDQVPANEAVDEAARGRRRPPEHVREVGHGRRPCVGQDVERGQLREAHPQLAELAGKADDQLAPQRPAHRDAVRQLARVLQAVAGGRNVG